MNRWVLLALSDLTLLCMHSPCNSILRSQTCLVWKHAESLTLQPSARFVNEGSYVLDCNAVDVLESKCPRLIAPALQAADFIFGPAAGPHDYLHEVSFKLLGLFFEVVALYNFFQQVLSRWLSACWLQHLCNVQLTAYHIHQGVGLCDACLNHKTAAMAEPGVLAAFNSPIVLHLA